MTETKPIKQPDWWLKAQRDSYVFAGDCKRCGKSKPVNKYGDCEFCDKVVSLPPEEQLLA